MTTPTGRRDAAVQFMPDLIQAGNTLAAFAHRVTIPVGSTSVFTSCTAIASSYLIENALEIGSVGALVGSAIAGLVYQVWPGSGFNVAFNNGVAAMVPVTANVKFSAMV